MGTAVSRRGELAAPTGSGTSRPSPAEAANGPRRSSRQDPADATEAVTLTFGEAASAFVVILVAAVATASLALAELGRHSGLLAVTLAVAAAATVVGLAALAGQRPRIVLDLRELVLVMAVIVVAVWFFVPGFRYTFVDKDPGNYVAHAYVIEREGDTVVEDPITAHGLPRTNDLAGRFPGIWDAPGEDPDQVTSQFFPLYSATLATALDLGGDSALFNLNPVLAVVSVTVLTVAARRAFGTTTAAVAAALMVTSMMQVWQAKYPSTEILAQLLLSGTLLCGVLAVRQRWTGGAFLGGLLLGTGFLARPDGFLYILMAAVLTAGAIALGRADRRSTALGVGLGISLPYAFYMAYVVKADYSAANQVPGPLLVLGTCLLVVGVAALGRQLVPEATIRRSATWWRGQRSALGLALAVAFGVILAGMALRKPVFGPSYSSHILTGAESVRSFDDLNLLWLSWFITPVGLIAMWLGCVLLALGRWRPSQLLMVTPGALLLPLYLYDARVSMRLMWWVRRFVPAVLPAVLLLAAIAVAWAMTHRHRALQLGGVAVLGFLLASFVVQSLPLREHQEMDGSWELAGDVAALAGNEQGVFLYPQPTDDLYDPLANTPGAVWWIFDQVSNRLPARYDVDLIEAHQAAFPRQPVFLVTTSRLPERLPQGRFTLAGTVSHDLVVWEETAGHRPDEPERHPMTLRVWRYE